MDISIDKSKVVPFKKRDRNIHAYRKLKPTLLGVSIEIVDRYTYLGLTIHKHLSWTPHFNSLKKRISHTSNMISRIINQYTHPTVETGI